MLSSIRTAIVDDHLIFRKGVIEILTLDSKIEVVAEGSTAASAVEISETFKPDILLLDIHVHGSGIDAIPEIRKASPKTKIIMLTASESEIKLQMAFDAGAKGYILKEVEGAELVSAVHTVFAGETYISPTVAGKFLSSSHLHDAVKPNHGHLTARELEISHRVALGLTNKEIARDFKVTEKTVKHHMTQIMSKLCFRNRVELALHFAMKMGSQKDFETRKIANISLPH